MPAKTLTRTIAGLVVVALLESSNEPRGQVPEVAAQDPVAFVMTLADASVPSGLEVRRADAHPRSRPVRIDRAPAPLNLEDLAAAFNLYHVDYHAVVVDGVLVIRPTTGRAPYLDSHPAIGEIHARGLMQAVRKVFAPLLPRGTSEGGQIGSAINLSAEEGGAHVLVSVEQRGRTVLEMLNEIVKTSPRAWLVETEDHLDEPSVTAFGLVHVRGSITRVQIASPPR